MSIAAYLKKNRIAYQEANRDDQRHWYFSPAGVRLLQAWHRSLAAHLHGRTLDVGAGQLPLRPLVQQYGGQYESIDIERRHPDLIHVGDAQTLANFPDNTYDTVISSQVLEHLPDPFAAFAAIARGLKPGGKLILPSPHLSRMHEVPHDYYRFTEFGLRAMSERVALTPLETYPNGGLITFLGQQTCSLWMTVMWGIPLLRWPAYALNRLAVSIFLGLDRLIGFPRLYPTTLTLVAQKPPSPIPI